MQPLITKAFMVSNKKYQRILIKISGEFFLSNNNTKFNSIKLNKLCNDIKNVLNTGINISLVIGGGNIIRGRDFTDNELISREDCANCRICKIYQVCSAENL